MGLGKLTFDVIGFDVTVEDGVKVKWQGRELDSGRLTIKLAGSGSKGVIDYDTGEVEVEFHVRIAFEEISEILNDLGVEPEVTAPAEAIIRSRGSVFENDHSLRLAGKGEILKHPVLNSSGTRIEIRAPSQ